MLREVAARMRANMARQIDYYFSAASPWAYIGHAAFEDLAKSHGCKVVYKPVFLGELFAETGGLPLAKRHPARQRYRMMELQRWREKRGLNFHLKPQHWPFDPKLADGVVIAANEAGSQSRAVHALDVQEHLGRSAAISAMRRPSPTLPTRRGCRARSWSRARASPEIAAIYEQNRQDAIAADVFGSPGYVLDGEVFWGQDRLELLGDALKSGRKPYRAAV